MFLNNEKRSEIFPPSGYIPPSPSRRRGIRKLDLINRVLTSVVEEFLEVARKGWKRMEISRDFQMWQATGH